ncbi:hypothetical protein M406DRAFT_340650 [Cryphonectria parasitica EP155]|uniref:Uncharacterized protein n=1 Tax=Cryphonectria parasitica (strain ATCC 38755 / EP155) TaxID=660469 RepID=A0A9P5CPA4_CRYP1|nr:uncharacterized protein M406DRAFT_340650 [Cryphonectria parasitica EP155]KAF3765197.1 hypothetical protein M406DRAFT_340650 [Cryphonectria parasitica EP155]
MSSSRSSRGSHGSKKDKGAQRSLHRMIESLQSHSINTLTELVRIERVAATCENENDAVAFQGPMTEAWSYYVSSNQFLTELRGLTRSYPFCGDILADAQARVRNDPESNRSWNMAWLCLRKIVDDNLVSTYSVLEASRLEMWGGRAPTAEEVDQLARCFEYEWNSAVATMLRHWSVTPTWY